MALRVRIIGQGLAGSLLGWNCERAKIDFEIIDAGHDGASSRIGAGIINPVTGQRLVKSWRVDELLSEAVAAYRELEEVLGISLLESFRVRRFFRDDRERRIAAAKLATGELSPYVTSWDSDGCWIERAYRVDTRRLNETLRQPWLRQGRLREEKWRGEHETRSVTICCHGAGESAGESASRSISGLGLAKGEILSVASSGVVPGVILNRGHWILPVASAEARVGATFQPDNLSADPTAEAADQLLATARDLLHDPAVRVIRQEVGWRVTTSDKHPLVGFVPWRGAPRGVFNGLGSKGCLLAPWLAGQWIAHLTKGSAFDPAVDVSRFAR